MPTNIVGFSRVEQMLTAVSHKDRQKNQINSDLVMQEGKPSYFDDTKVHRSMSVDHSKGEEDKTSPGLKAKVRFSQQDEDDLVLRKKTASMPASGGLNEENSPAEKISMRSD